MGILIGVLEQGLIYGIMALGVYITYKILDTLLPWREDNGREATVCR